MKVGKAQSYFHVYGGVNAVIASRFFWGAIGITAISAGYFTSPGWWELVVTVVPGLVGFSIAGVAIFISLGNDSLRSVFAGQMPGDKEVSPFMKFMAMFTHFIVVQLLAFLFAFVSKAIYETDTIVSASLVSMINEARNMMWLLGGLLFAYAVFLSMALALEIFRLARMIDEFQTRQNSGK